MDTSQFTGRRKPIPVADIEVNPENPRGDVPFDSSFERLVSSISEVGILVPLIVREKPPGKFQLVDGERRFRAAQRLNLHKVPAHVLKHDSHLESLRKYMFHLHMTREQWTPLAQCKSLAEMYPELEAGLTFAEKPTWTDRIERETWMNTGTAHDRVHVLAWPKSLKEKIYSFNSEEPTRNIYSYILAIEANVVEPSITAFPRFYNHGKPPEKKANMARECLLKKTIEGINGGEVTSRDQIRQVTPLFKPGLKDPDQKVAETIFANLIEKEQYSFDDARADIETRLPMLVAEKPPKPQKIIGSIKSLTETLRMYRVSYIDATVGRESSRKRVKEDLAGALSEMIQVARDLKSEL